MKQTALRELNRVYLAHLRAGALRCVLCGLLINSKKDLSVEHIIPRCKGGTTTPDNCAPAHKWCNQAKADHSMPDWHTHGHIYLKELRDAWHFHKIKYNVEINECIKALQRQR